MAIEVVRLNNGHETWKRTGSAGSYATACTSAEIEYFVKSPGTKQAAILAVLNACPAEYGGLPFKEVRFDGYEGNSGDVNITAVYAEEDSGSGGGSGSETDETPTMNFDCSAGTMHRVQAISQKCVYAGDGETQESDSEAAAVPIGWNGKTGSESEASGVDVPIGVLRETYTKWMKISAMDSAWKRKVGRLVGKVNTSSFHGWDPGECMFLGCSFTAPTRGKTKVQVSFHFGIQLGESNAKVAGVSVGNKKGYEHIWAISRDVVEGGRNVRKVKKIYNAVVCHDDGFGSLGV